MRKILKKPVALAVGAAIAGSMAVSPVAQAAAFTATDLGQGYATFAAEESGGAKGHEGKCGEGKCGGDKKGAEGKCGAHDKGHEGKCGEGKCGGAMKPGEKKPEEKKPEG